MARWWTLTTVLACGTLLAASAHAQARLESGEWEQTSSTEIPGMYTGPIESTSRSCYTTGDQKIWADKDAWAADMAKAQDANCKTKDLKQDGTALAVTLVCDEGKRYDLRNDFRGTTGTMDTQAWDGSEKGATSHVELKRIAEKCSEESIESWKRWNPGKEFVP